MTCFWRLGIRCFAWFSSDPCFCRSFSSCEFITSGNSTAFLRDFISSLCFKHKSFSFSTCKFYNHPLNLIIEWSENYISWSITILERKTYADEMPFIGIIRKSNPVEILMLPQNPWKLEQIYHTFLPQIWLSYEIATMNTKSFDIYAISSYYITRYPQFSIRS